MTKITNFCFHSDSDNLYQMDRHFDELSVDSFKELSKDKNTEQRIALILSEYEYEKNLSLPVPTIIIEEQMKYAFFGRLRREEVMFRPFLQTRGHEE